MTLVLVLVFWAQFVACVSALAGNASLIGENTVQDDPSCHHLFCMKDENARFGPSALEVYSILLLGTVALFVCFYDLLTHDDDTKERANDNPAANDEAALAGPRPPVVQEIGDDSILNHLANDKGTNAAKSVKRKKQGAWRSNSMCVIVYSCIGMIVGVVAIASLVMCVHSMPPLSEEVYERAVPYSTLQENSGARLLNSVLARWGFPPAAGYEAFAAYRDSRTEESAQWAELAVDRSATALAVAAACIADGHNGPCDTDRGLAMALESCERGSALGYATALRIHLHRGDVAGASTLVHEFDAWTITAASPGIYDAMAYRAVYEYQRGNAVAALKWAERSERVGGNFLGASVIAMVACDAHEYEDCLALARKGIAHDHDLAYLAMLRYYVEGHEEVDRIPSLDILQFLVRNECHRKHLGELILEYAIGLDPTTRRLGSRAVQDIDRLEFRTSRDRKFNLMQWYLTHAWEMFGNSEAERLLQRSVRDESTPCFSCATTGISGHVLSLTCNNFEQGPHLPLLENGIQTTLFPRRMHTNEGAQDDGLQQSPLSCRNVHGEGVFNFAAPDGISVYPSLSWLDWRGHPLHSGEAVGYDMDHFSVEVWVKPERELTRWCETLGPGCGMLLFPSHGRETKSGIGISAGTNAVCVQGHYSSHMPCYLKYTGDLSQWTHVVVTVSKVNVLNLYVNGSLKGTRMVEREALLLPYRLNVWETSYGAYVGEAASVNIWDRCLSSDEVHERFVEAHTAG